MTYVKFRETQSGTEYWNKTLKRIELFPNGTAPNDIQTEGMVGQYSASGKVAVLHKDEKVVPAATVKESDEAEVVESLSIENEDITSINDETEIDLDLLDADELRDFAEQNGIEIPGNMKKAETIRNHIAAELGQ